MDAERLRRCVVGSGEGRIGARVEYHESIGSTNDRARALAATGEPEGTVVVAGEQVRGRGRATRTWHSKAGLGVYMSVLLRPAAAPASVPILGLLAAVSVVDALGALGVAGPRIEWPNDIVTPPVAGNPGRKLAGILTEARTAGGGLSDVVIGIGVNVNHGPEDFPPELRTGSVSMRQATGSRHDRCEVVGALVRSLATWYEAWESDGDGRIHAGFRARAIGLEGRRVRVGEGDRSWSGVTAGLSPDGAIRIRRDLEEGAVTEVRQGDLIRIEEAG